MTLIEEIEKVAQEEAAPLELKVHKVYFENQSDGKHLFIIVDKKQGVDLKTISDFTEAINPKLDEIAELNFPYMLECQSRGAEHEIEKEELPDYLNFYMEVTMKDGKKYLGTLSEIKDEKILLTYFLKGRKKKAELNLSDISKIELRVKF